mgnify:CR=1 FL=1
MEPIIIRSKLKELVNDISISKDYADALDKEVIKLIQKSVRRAKDNHRNTIMPRDL